MSSGIDVAVLLSTRNRAASLEATLSSLMSVDVAGLRWEVVVVDNGSDDRTPEVLASAAGALPLRILQERRPGKTHALNLAMPTISAPLVIFTDDDVLHAEGWVKAYLAAARRWTQHQVFGGPIEPLFPANAPSWLMTHPFCEPGFSRFEHAATEGPMLPLPFGPNFAVRGEALRGFVIPPEIGPCGTSFAMGEDTIIVRLLTTPAKAAIFVPSAAVRHLVREEQLSMRWLLQRAFNLGRGLRRQAEICGTRPRFTRRQLWVRVGLSAIRRAWFAPRGLPIAFEPAAGHQFLRGYLYEATLIARAAAHQPSSNLKFSSVDAREGDSYTAVSQAAPSNRAAIDRQPSNDGGETHVSLS